MIPNHQEFKTEREAWRRSLAKDDELRRNAVTLQIQADSHRYTYLREWNGVPIIRLPDDIVVLQEIIFTERPTAIVEVGVARGGGLILDASLMSMVGLKPRVLGLDIAIYPHTLDAITGSSYTQYIELWQGDSISGDAQDRVAKFLNGNEEKDSPILLILDSNHTEAHVLAELRSFTPLLPVGSLILVADTLVEEFPSGYYADRPWDKGNNPATAIDVFLQECDGKYERDAIWGRRALITEFRDGIVRKTKH
jgi:cephalosporin hydroxylase